MPECHEKCPLSLPRRLSRSKYCSQAAMLSRSVCAVDFAIDETRTLYWIRNGGTKVHRWSLATNQPMPDLLSGFVQPRYIAIAYRPHTILYVLDRSGNVMFYQNVSAGGGWLPQCLVDRCCVPALCSDQLYLLCVGLHSAGIPNDRGRPSSRLFFQRSRRIGRLPHLLHGR